MRHRNRSHFFFTQYSAVPHSPTPALTPLSNCQIHSPRNHRPPLFSVLQARTPVHLSSVFLSSQPHRPLTRLGYPLYSATVDAVLCHRRRPSNVDLTTYEFRQHLIIGAQL
ncbi:hypothetical protein PIB30_075497 [Stylosanthes scabra]|uniref:Uncharacterized protein n=1 Tax=Stylosanthes scabra TaxID=79078 RepID=A0ABU6ZNX3_9FABA|nr:hypothetical protein [Stylosanthes scabra]